MTILDIAAGTKYAFNTKGKVLVDWTEDGALTVRQENLFRRFFHLNDTWIEVDMIFPEGAKNASVDGAFIALGDMVTRVADHEVIHLGESGAFTDSGAFDTSPGKDWIFREGDALTGRILHADDMNLEPTPDLVARFASGAPIPHPKRKH
jgi:hypothetical protein